MLFLGVGTGSLVIKKPTECDCGIIHSVGFTEGHLRFAICNNIEIGEDFTERFNDSIGANAFHPVDRGLMFFYSLISDRCFSQGCGLAMKYAPFRACL